MTRCSKYLCTNKKNMYYSAGELQRRNSLKAHPTTRRRRRALAQKFSPRVRRVEYVNKIRVWKTSHARASTSINKARSRKKGGYRAGHLFDRNAPLISFQ